jgi:hypothetical protein
MPAQGLFSDRRVNLWLSQLTSVYLGLAFDDPNIAGAYASEVFGGSYARILVAFDTPDGRAIFNTSDVVWTGMPATRVTHVVAWNAQYNGDMEYSVPLAKAEPVEAGKKFTVPSATLAISLP